MPPTLRSQASPPWKRMMDQRLNGYAPLPPTDKTKDFLQQFFTVLVPEGQHHLGLDVSRCNDDAAIRQLVQSIRTSILIPMKSHGGKTPTEITPSPRDDLERSIESFHALAIEPITRSPQQKLRENCLQRDGNKCVITGYYSIRHSRPPNAKTTRLEAAHIIPSAMGAFDRSNSGEVDKNEAIWTSLRRYFPVLRQMEFTGQQLNEERNALMLDSQLHTEFGQFNIIFEETANPNEYKITIFPQCTTAARGRLPANSIVKLKVHDGRWDLPDPRLLKVHASIGRFLHMSGQAEIIDKVLEDFEGCGGLAPSGSTNIEELLAASSLSLLSLDVSKSPGSQMSPKKQRGP